MTTAAIPREAPAEAPPLLPPGTTYGSIDAAVADGLLERRVGRTWWIAFGISTALTLLLIVAMVVLFAVGIGTWGVNTSVIWGFGIANYVWWIGIGNAGTLISSLLLLTRQAWRASINRFAEAMTLFAAAIAGLFPILHLGRPYLFYWLVPYPSTMEVWPQWRSPLVWDFFAIASYILFSLLFWYVGLIPDLATLRDRARRHGAQRFYGALALGWRGSARAWRHYEAFYWTMAALAVPLVCSVHSVVGLDFAASLMPGWNETIYPPYFVVGAMYSGFAMVVLLAALVRAGLGLEALITHRHFDAMAKLLLFGAITIGISYGTEWFLAWYAGSPADREIVVFEFTGAYAPIYLTMLALNVVLPQAFWFPAVRRNILLIVIIAVLINVGMWLERVLIILVTLSRSYIASAWDLFVPTLWDWAFVAGTLGFFAFLFLLFVRVVPAISMHEVKQLAREEGRQR